MADNGDDISETEDTGGFVFGEERTTDGERDVGDRLTDGAVVAAVILVAIVVVAVAAAAVVQPFGSGSGGAGNTAPGASAGTTTAGAASGTDRAETGTVGGPTPTDSATTSRRTGTSPPLPSATATTTIAATATTTSATQTATASPATTETTTPAESKNETGGNGTESAPTTPGERSPVIETFSVTDRSSGGAAIFDVAWNVTDSNSDLVAVRVRLVADPSGEAKIIERQRFDVGGAQSAGSTTFEIPDGAGEVYELRIVAVDSSGNTAFQLTRAVANGSPDE